MAPGAGASAVKPRETAIVGDPDAADTQALLNVVREGHSPFQVVALGSPHGQHPGRDDMQLTQARQLPSNADVPFGRIAAVPLMQDRGLLDGRTAAYVCRDFACEAPVQEPDKLQAQLALR